MTTAQIKEVVGYFADGARRAREAGLDGVELHGANGYLITQFLSSAINDRKDEYGGSLENRARFVLDIVKAVRAKVGKDFHFQMKISAQEYADALTPLHLGSSGNTLEESIQVCKWLVEAGIDALHVSTGAFFPHPKNPCGSDLPVEDLVKSYDSMISSGERTFANFLLFHGASGLLARQAWNREAGPPDEIEGKNLPDARAIKAAVSVPVICTGGFQTASVIEKAITNKDCDAVSMARTLVANNDLPKVFASGQDKAAEPCSYCNRCLVNVVENPLGCYDVRRFPSREAMVAEDHVRVRSAGLRGSAGGRLSTRRQRCHWRSEKRSSRRTNRPSSRTSSPFSRKRAWPGPAPGRSGVSIRREPPDVSAPSSACPRAARRSARRLVRDSRDVTGSHPLRQCDVRLGPRSGHPRHVDQADRRSGHQPDAGVDRSGLRAVQPSGDARRAPPGSFSSCSRPTKRAG